MEVIEEIRKYKIVRETSKYNKYIKWFTREYTLDGKQISSIGYRTRKEAIDSILQRDGHIMPIGNNTYRVKMEEIRQEV